MAKLIECIPNFSCSKEKDEATYNALVETAKSVPGCTLFDAQTDGNHNRCVFTLIGSPEAIEEVAFQLTKVATERIDMNKHHGEHKRMGATDVIPFVPQMDVTVEEAVEMSKRVAQRIWDELKVPSFLYEDSATRPERSAAIQNGLKGCTKTPMEMMELIDETLTLAHSLLGRFNDTSASDLGVAFLSLKAGIQGAWLNVLINVGSLKDQEFAAEYRARGEKLLAHALPLADECYAEIVKLIDG